MDTVDVVSSTRAIWGNLPPRGALRGGALSQARGQLVGALAFAALRGLYSGGLGLLATLGLPDLSRAWHAAPPASWGGCTNPVTGRPMQGQRQCTKSHCILFAYLRRHKYIFTKLTIVIRMQNQLAAARCSRPRLPGQGCRRRYHPKPAARPPMCARVVPGTQSFRRQANDRAA